MKQKKKQLKPKKKLMKSSPKTPLKKSSLSSKKKKYKNGLLKPPLPAEETKTKQDAEYWREQYEAINSKYQFLMAEYANYKKNNIKQIEKFKKYEGEQLIKKLINEVMDDFDRALSQTPDTQNMDSFKKGISMIHDRFMSLLQDTGVKKLSSKGQLFDPSIHFATNATPSKEVPPDHIVYTIKEAYFLQDKLIRPAEVIVSRKPEENPSEKKENEQ